MDGYVGSDPLERPADEPGDRLRRRDSERVDDADLLRARLDRAPIDLLVEGRLGARRVDAEERGVDAVVRGEAHRAGHAAEHLLARDTDRSELQIRDRR